MKHLGHKAIYLSVALCAMLIGYWLISEKAPQGNVQNKHYFITAFEKKSDKFQDFTLTKHDGTQFSLSELKGKPTLIYFGFTHCPDFCPTSLQIMDQVATELDVQRVFITVDPERDTQAALNDYVKLYNKGLIGLTGSLEETDKIAKNWMVYYSFNKQSPTDQDYVVDHSTYMYLLDKNGKVNTLIRYEASSQDIIEYIQNHL